nr:hypothetical protein Iba_chr12eCG3810 [Ipomoea batatas]
MDLARSLGADGEGLSIDWDGDGGNELILSRVNSRLRYLDEASCAVVLSNPGLIKKGQSAPLLTWTTYAPRDRSSNDRFPRDREVRGGGKLYQKI